MAAESANAFTRKVSIMAGKHRQEDKDRKEEIARRGRKIKITPGARPLASRLRSPGYVPEDKK